MATNAPIVFGFLAAPSREASLHAVSLAILKVRALGATYKEIARALDVSPDCVENAAAEKSLLSLDAALRLCYLFPSESAPIRDLMIAPPAQPTMADRLERIERELDAIRKEAA